MDEIIAAVKLNLITESFYISLLIILNPFFEKTFRPVTITAACWNQSLLYAYLAEKHFKMFKNLYLRKHFLYLRETTFRHNDSDFGLIQKNCRISLPAQMSCRFPELLRFYPTVKNWQPVICLSLHQAGENETLQTQAHINTQRAIKHNMVACAIPCLAPGRGYNRQSSVAAYSRG